MLVGSLAEIVSIGAVVPFIALLARPGQAADFPFLQGIFGALGWQDIESMALPMSLAFVAIVFAATAIRLGLLYASNKLVYVVGHDIGVKLYHVILHQSYAYHIARNTSEVIGSVNKVEILISSFLRPVMDGVIAVILSLAILAALMMVDIVSVLVAGFLFAALYMFVIRVFRSRLKLNSKVINDAQGARIRAVQEGLGGIRDVILDANQSHYTREFARVDRKFRRTQAANVFFSEAPRFFVETIGIMLIVALAYALSQRPGGLMEALPILGALALGAARLLPQVHRIYNAWAKYTGNYKVLEGVLTTLSLSSPRPPDADKPKLPFSRMIELDRLCFRYAPEEPEVLKAISLTIPKGSRVGIVGKTGGGKSTLMDILMGLLEPTDGRILVDGIPIDCNNQDSWRSLIAHVPQHIYLSDASIAENIALGVAPENINQDRVRVAARQAQIADFIETHRQGYATRVGERGVQLSGGQRQRIGIARALYKDAEILVFDEASSALDSSTEAAVMEAVRQLEPDLTVFIIAHRVETLRVCDLLLRIEEGRLKAIGSYAEVVEGNFAHKTASTNK
jgi:ABC-type multidrug transport system fused ATPase/permease subunit